MQLFPRPDAGIKIDVNFPREIVEAARAEGQKLWWAGASSGAGWGFAVGIFVGVLLAWWLGGGEKK